MNIRLFHSVRQNQNKKKEKCPRGALGENNGFVMANKKPWPLFHLVLSVWTAHMWAHW